MNSSYVGFARKLAIVFVLIGLGTLPAQRFNWARQSPSSGTAISTAVAVAPNGNVVSVGYFLSDMDLDPGPGSYQVTGPSLQYSTFIQVLSANGAFLWGGAIQPTTGSNIARSVEVDSLGNIVVVGDLSGSSDLDIGPGVDSGSVNSTGIYLIRLAPGGSYLGGIAIPGAGLQYENGSVLAVEGSNSIYVVANFVDSVEISPGVVLQDSGIGDVFLARFDSSLNHVWHTHLGSSSQDLGFAVATDPSRVVITARFIGIMDVDPGPAAVIVGSPTTLSGLVASYSHAGAYEWASVFQHTVPGEVTLMGITVAPSGDVLVAGQFSGTLDMDPGPGTSLVASNGGDDALMARLSPTGALEWARSIGGTNADMGRNMATDTAGNAYVSLAFYSTMDMDPGTGTYFLPQLTSPFIYFWAVEKLDTLGNFVWAAGLPCSGGESLGDVKVKANGEIYGVGGFGSTIDLDPSATAIHYLSAVGSSDEFLFVWSQDSCTDMRVRVDSVHGLTCTSGTGTAFTHAAGGLAPYNYVWGTVPPDLDSVVAVTQPGMYSISVTDARNCAAEALVDIPGPSAGGYDLQVNMVAAAFRPGVVTAVTLDAFNAGCTPINGQVKLKLSPLTTYVSANPVPTSIGPDTIAWNFSGLDYDSGHLVLQVNLLTAPTAQMGDTVHLPVVITPFAGDDEPLDNFREDYNFLVVNSLDPNRIDAYPPGVCEEHYVQSGTAITYTVQFQNTGNAEALEVEVLDTLPLGIDPASFTLLGSSHPVVASVIHDRVVALSFHDIHLPDSTSNEPASHGYAVFRVMPVPNLPSDTLLATRAAIYFDLNPAVLTNYAQLTMVDVVPVCQVGVNPARPAASLTVYPNPTTDAFWISGLAEDTDLRVLDMCGRAVWTGHFQVGSPLRISAQGWARGVYWLEAGAGGKRVLVR